MEEGHSIKYLIEPVVIALNYLDQAHDYEHVTMMGISGRGWTTTLAAAVDPRIQHSYPVAGSYPIYLRSDSISDWGDWEQTVPQLYGETCNYLELYVLGSYGTDRQQLQVINQYDPCCFAGIKSETYRDIVRQRVRQLGRGNFDVLVDDTHDNHAISEYVMGKFLQP